MQPWVDRHKDWIALVTEKLLQRKNRSLDNFLKEWLHGSFPLDVAGILIIARAYKVHVAVFFNDSYWTTTAVSDLNKCKIFLLYRGSLVFEDSRRVTVAEYTERRRLYSQLDHYYKKTEKEPKKRADSPVVHAHNAIPSDSETLENIMLSNNDKSLNSSSSEEDMEHDTPSNKEEEQTVVHAPPSDKSASEQNIMPAKPSQKEQSLEEAAEIEKNIMPQDEVDMDLEKIMEDTSNLPKESESHATTSSSHSSSSSSSSDQEISSEDSSFICSTATCGEVFDTAAGLRAHEQKHSGRRSKDGRIHCDYPRCIKHYGTKHALQRPKKNTHDNPGKLFYCVERSAKGKDCIKSYPTQQQLDQHVWGVHGEGFTAYCGKRFKWPGDRHKHQQECKKCKHSLA